MNWEAIKADWQQLSRKVKEKWGELTDDELQQLAGQKDQLIGLLQKKYAMTKEDAKKQLEELANTLDA
mgnify:FL=1